MNFDTSARSRTALVAGALVTVAVLGCGRSYDASVSGRVTLDGEPVPIGNIAFEPSAGGPMALAKIGSDGSYSLGTLDGAGLPPGDYRVKVLAREKTPLPPGGGLPPPGKLLVPERYTQTATSGLQYDVPPGKNRIDVELTASP